MKKNCVFRALIIGSSAFIVGGCEVTENSPPVEEEAQLPDSFVYESSTDEFEGITTSTATRWYPDETEEGGALVVEFKCVAKSDAQTLSLLLDNVKLDNSEDNFYVPYQFNLARIKLDKNEPFNVLRNQYSSTYKLEIDSSDLNQFGNFSSSNTLSVRVSNGTNFMERTFTVNIDLNEVPILNVLRDCKNALDPKYDF